jgi:hypothetical protein
MQELLYANKLTARRKSLGLHDSTDGAADASSGSASDAAILQGKLAEVVHRSAVKKLPANVEMRLGMLKAVADVPVQRSDLLQATILDGFFRDLGNVRP